VSYQYPGERKISEKRKEMATKYKHTNIIARDWEALARFYVKVFDCVRVPPERHLSGEWLERGTGVPDAQLSGIHLRLPGWGEDGPTLEIFQYTQNEPKPTPAANREGFGHIAFEVDDVERILEEIKREGGSTVGEVISQEIEGVGGIQFVYATDPEGNIIEIQSWG
jgi:catechol 2,3-dioxygenase-like lactoylglutathione lyase family enzyme